MHEGAIADSILELAAHQVPDGATLKSVTVRAGPLRAIVQQDMSLAWKASTCGTPYATSTIKVEQLPWRFRCDSCHRDWTCDDRFEPCTCGNTRPRGIGGDELAIISIEVGPAATSGPQSAPDPASSAPR
jgi:Zn finger protein HypA/HybF involved in hydrogenase expression